MGTVTGTLVWATAAGYATVAILAARRFRRERTAAHAALAVALGLLGTLAISGRAVALVGLDDLRLVGQLNIAILAASAYALLEYRARIVPVAAVWRAAAAVTMAGVTGLLLAAGFPYGPEDAASVPAAARAAALGFTVLWSVLVLESSYRIFRHAGRRQPVERANLRLLASGYLGIAVILLALSAAPWDESLLLPFVVQVAATLIAGLFLAAVAPPLRLRRHWLRRASLRAAADIAKVGSWYWDIRAGLTTWSPEIYEITGLAPTDEASFATYLEAVDPADRDRVEPVLRAHLEAGTAYSIDHRIARPDGTTRWVHAAGRVVLDAAAGRAIAMYGSVQDITDRKAAEDAVRAGEKRLAETQALARLGSWSMDVSSATFTWSEELDKISGLTEFGIHQDPSVDSVLEVVHPEDRDEAAGLLADVMAHGEDADLELRLVRPDGEITWVHARGTAVRDKAGQIVELRGSAQDITERKRDQQLLALRLRQQEAISRLSQRALEATDIGDLLDETVQLVAETLEVEFTSAFEPSPGATALHLRAGMGWDDDDLGRVIPMPDAGNAALPTTPIISDDLQTDSRLAGASFLLSKGIVSSILVPVNVGHDVYGLLGAHSPRRRRFGSDDIHFLQAAANVLALAHGLRDRRHELERSEEHFRVVVDANPEAVLVIDRSGRTLLANETAARLLGADQQALVGASVQQFLPIDGETALDLASRTRRSGPPARRDLWARRTDGTPVPVEVSLAPVITERGVQIIVSVRDLSDRRKAEQALRQAYEREREAAERLRAVDRMKDAFLEAVSHELRTPLTAVLGLSETMLRPEVEEQRATHRMLAERVAHNAKRLDTLLGDLLDLDRITRGVLEPRRRTIDVGELVRRVVASVDLGDRLVKVDAHEIVGTIGPAQAERIVENLLMNAVRHTPAGSPVWVSVRRDSAGVLLCVDDAGQGISDSDKLSIFEPFHRGPSPAARARGAGIGLALVARFAELHGGRAWVEDRDGGGAAFRVYLPDRGLDIAADESGGGDEELAAEHSAPEMSISGRSTTDAPVTPIGRARSRRHG